MATKSFIQRHVGITSDQTAEMLKKIGVGSIDELIDQTIPAKIRLKNELNVPEGMSEFEYSKHIEAIGNRNKPFKSYIGQGYYNTIVPPVIRRNILENPGWYTAYTPYQAEISQGRLEGLLNFQTMVCDLTGMELANASLLDEGTAAAEAMIMFYNSRSRDKIKSGASKFFVSSNCYEQTIEVIRTRAFPLGIDLVIADENSSELDDSYFGAILQYPNKFGQIDDYSSFTTDAKEKDCMVAVAADILALALLTPPGEWGADAVVGSSQRFGVPMGYGGPHAAYFATKESFKRNIPGRIIGVSVDRHENRALRMALQTREQHIRRDKATSNICTAQALLAIMAGMYAVYHGAEGIKGIAQNVNNAAKKLRKAAENMGYEVINDTLFDTVTLKYDTKRVIEVTQKHQVNFNYFDDDLFSISVDETVEKSDLAKLLGILAEISGEPLSIEEVEESCMPKAAQRTSPYLTHEVFNTFHSETEMMRYLKRLENKDVSLTHSMISLGSCTMKLNAASELYPVSNPRFADIHPFAPLDQTEGYQEVFNKLEEILAEITGFDAVSFQPNSGAQGEYAGLLTIKAYHENNGDYNRNIALIPSSAHGTNPASAVMAGMKVVVVKCDEDGNIDIEDLKAKSEQYKEALSCLMVTYPSTHGVYEESIMEITQIVHDNGGQVYMDGANMNAQVGLTNPGNIGADVCHLNLHKTFAIPHGGGGPGVGPIGVAKHLTPFLPGHHRVDLGYEHASGAVSSAPWGSALILLISYGYCRMLGKEGLLASTQAAILNANYLKSLLEKDYPVLYQGNNGRVAHEMILDCRDFKKSAKIEVEDIAKRLIDYGFHAPTVSFPVAGTLMIEPTESESMVEIDRFAEAMLSIRKEIQEVVEGKFDENNVLKNAPHTAKELLADNWDKPYSRSKAAYPLKWLENNKYWVSVGRVNNAYGDRNLICSCEPIESYMEPELT